jgi:multifunctional beta-oxidation protein
VSANFENLASPSKPSSAAVAPSNATALSSTTYTYTEKEVILYALGVGAKRTDLSLVYENHDPFIVLPTFAVIPAFNAQMSVSFGDLVPNFNPMMLLHGEQYTQLMSPIPTSGKLVSTPRVIEVLDKGKAASVCLGITTTDSSTGKVIAENEFTIFIRGSGGFGGSKTTSRTGAAVAENKPPARPADFMLVYYNLKKKGIQPM